MLKDTWHLTPIILSRQPARGRTLIEKFEQEAGRAAYAIALLTPDDMISFEDQGRNYAQARPNVIFELGWFYGKLKRERVCILFRHGTAIHSDLDGINRIQYRENVQESYLELKTELEAAGLLIR